jgi:putative ABC transport system ATP-binding protein
VATHDERLLPLADQIVRLSPAATAASQPPRRLDCRPGQVVFEQGARSDLVYTVEEGEVEIVCQRTDGGVELLALLGPGWGYHPRDGQGRHLAPKARTARNRGEPAPEGPSWSMPRQ